MRPTVYFATNHAWDAYHHFYQGLARALSGTRPVLYVDPPRSGRFESRLERQGDNLWVLQSGAIKGGHRRLVRPLRDRMLASQVRSACDSLPAFSGSLTVWTYTSDAAQFIRETRQRSVSVYWTGDEVVDPFERRLLRVTDHVFAVSPAALLEKRRVVGARARLMPMACDVSAYEHAGRSYSIPNDMSHLPRPIFGYGGAIGIERIDRSLLRRLADATTGSVVLVGPVSSLAREKNDADPLPNNVHFLGHRNERDAPRYVAAFDVALIPYTLTRFNIGSNPMKTYQYLAAGKPVVATCLPALEPLRAVVALANTPDEFVEAALSATRSPVIDAEVRVAVAREFTYERLVQKIDAVLENECD